jgi:hypothetical protein
VLETGADGKLSCLVQVRSANPVDPAVVAEALAVAVAAAEGGGRPSSPARGEGPVEPQ